MYSSSRFNQAVLLQMPGVSVDLLKAPPVLTGIGAWCSLPPRAKNDDRAVALWQLAAASAMCTQARREQVQFSCTVQFSFGARSPAWVDGIVDAEWKGLPGAVAFWQIAALCRQPV